ncbi:MAG: DUF4263 domain-containing protein [Halobacteriovoraceae bacterium]|nr:DUF4263 domain-containing protein [Halobacteriovoraceae bacterium]
MDNDNKKNNVPVPVTHNYSTTSTSLNTAIVKDPIVLSETSTTRKVIKAEIVENNPKNADASLKISIKPQKKGKNDKWEDSDSFKLASLKMGEEVQLVLNTEETLKLYNELCRLFALSKKGVLLGTANLVVGREEETIVTGHDTAAVIKTFLENGNHEDILSVLAKDSSLMITEFSIARIVNERKKILNNFEEQIKKDEWSEAEWQKFFEQNKWIFGYGLNYQILNTLADQPYYGGRSVEGKGDQRGDFLTSSAGDVEFTVLVEIKTPKTKLCGTKYRNGAFPVSVEVAGAVSQLQSNCRTWDRKSDDRDNRHLEAQNIKTVQSKGILVVGRLSQLSSEESESFQLFRRNLYNPEILTFDELLNRARYIVEHSSEKSVLNLKDHL